MAQSNPWNQLPQVPEKVGGNHHQSINNPKAIGETGGLKI